MSAVRFLYIVIACSKFQVNDTSPMLSVFQRYLIWWNFDQTANKLAAYFCHKFFLFCYIFAVHAKSNLGQHKNYVPHDSMVESSDSDQLSYGMNSENLWFSDGFRGDGG